jgi:hypothetical protein
VLCDAGGGTVDLISYEVDSVTPLELKELVPGKGKDLQIHAGITAKKI